MDLADEESEEVQTRHNLGGLSPVVSTDQVLLLFTQVWSSLGTLIITTWVVPLSFNCVCVVCH